jgi:hypothetical protein
MLTFRNSKIVYYGPHPCDNCSAMIVKMGAEWGGTAFNAPDGFVYPNTEWHPHVCDPADVVKQKRSLEQSYTKPDALVGINADGDMCVSYMDEINACRTNARRTNAISGQPQQRGVR